MFDHLTTLTPVEHKRALAAIDLAVECGVSYKYAYAYMASGEYDMLGMTNYHIFDAASAIMEEYNNTYAGPDETLVNWPKFRQRRDVWKKRVSK